MLALSPLLVAELAERVERAYLRRRPRLYREYAHSSVWTAAVEGLVALHHAHPNFPIDPELFVASQLLDTPGRIADPWSDLVHPAAMVRYRRRIRLIVNGLRAELRSELRLIRHRLKAGVPQDEVLGNPCARISALARYIAAYRDGGREAAAPFLEAVRHQHEACPLYRLACLTLLPRDAYPAPDTSSERLAESPSRHSFSMN